MPGWTPQRISQGTPSTIEMRFVGTNIPLYEVSTQVEDQAKRRVATRILSERDLAASTQVLGDFYHQATRPSRRGATYWSFCSDSVGQNSREENGGARTAAMTTNLVSRWNPHILSYECLRVPPWLWFRQDDCKVRRLDRRGGRWSALGGRRRSWLAGAWTSGGKTILPGAGRSARC